MITWPTDFPDPKVDFGNKVEPATVRTQMETGRFRQRQRFTRANRLVAVRWSLTDTQYALLEGVVQHTLHGGADWFTMTLNLGDGATSQTVRFVGGLAASYRPHLHWDVSATLEIESGAVWSAEVTEAALLLTVSGFFACELAIQRLQNAVEALQ